MFITRKEFDKFKETVLKFRNEEKETRDRLEELASIIGYEWKGKAVIEHQCDFGFGFWPTSKEVAVLVYEWVKKTESKRKVGRPKGSKNKK